MMSKQTTISAAASVFAMACFALLSPQSQKLETLAVGSDPVQTAGIAPMHAELPTFGS